MGVDFLYCGECRECFNSECFPNCYCESCDESFEHPSGHGYYCIDCGIEEDKFIEVDNNYFCNDECYQTHKKEHKQYLIDREKDIGKCSGCLKEQPSYKFRISGGGGPWCDYECVRLDEERKKSKK